jgi:hypothetical protein
MNDRTLLLVVAGVAVLGVLWMQSQQSQARTSAAVTQTQLALAQRPLGPGRDAQNISAISTGVSQLAGAIGSWFKS